MLLNIVRIIFLYIFRYKRRNDEAVNFNMQSNQSQDIRNNNLSDLHSEEEIDEDNQPKGIYMTARSDDDIIRNITTPVHKEGEARNSMIMVDNKIYSSSTDKNDDISMVDNEIYASEIKNNDSPVMVDNDIYMKS